MGFVTVPRPHPSLGPRPSVSGGLFCPHSGPRGCGLPCAHCPPHPPTPSMDRHSSVWFVDSLIKPVQAPPELGLGEPWGQGALWWGGQLCLLPPKPDFWKAGVFRTLWASEEGKEAVALWPPWLGGHQAGPVPLSPTLCRRGRLCECATGPRAMAITASAWERPQKHF